MAAAVISDDVAHPFMGQDVPWLLSKRAEVSADKPFIIWESFTNDDHVYTYRDFHQQVETVAGNLAARGLALGDKVLVHLENCPEFLLVWFACARLGAVAVTTNTRSSPEEVAYFAEHCGARLAVTQPKFVDLIAKAAPEDAVIFSIDNDPGKRDAAGFEAFATPFRVLLEDTPVAPQRPADPALPVSVQYTSGTTSRPKGVVWTHANALWGARVNAAHARLDASDTTPVFLPLFHTNAIGYSTLATLWSGGTMVLQPKFSASRFWDIAVRHRCTWANMIGFTIKALLSHPKPEAHSFRFWACAADVNAIRDMWGIKTIGWWGMTETISHGTVSEHNWLAPEMSMGRPAPEYEIRVLKDGGASVGPGETGRLQIKGVRGLSLFLEYLNDPRATEQAFTLDGWMETGDLVTLSSTGDFFFADREKDMLKIGGENVAASEIERVIAAAPGVLEVAVVGKPDPMLDEAAVAFVVKAPGADLTSDAIETVCRANLADFKVPREIIFLDELPKGTLDKVLKKELRASLAS